VSPSFSGHRSPPGEDSCEPPREPREPACCVGVAHELDVLLREVERGFGEHAQLGHGIDQRTHLTGELAGERTRGGAGRGRRGGVDQVGNAFGLRKIELAVEKCTTCELARRGETRSAFEATGEDEPQRGRAAVPLQLEHGLARVRRRCRKQQCETFVEGLAARAAKHREGRRTCGERSGNDGGGDLVDPCAGHPDDADAPASGRRGDRGDGLGGGCGRAVTEEAYPARRTGKVGSDSTFLSRTRDGTDSGDRESRV